MSSWRMEAQATPEMVIEAAADAIRFGFPREVDQTEIDAGTWFRMGPSVVWWIEAPQPAEPTWAFVHLAVSPEVRGRWPVRRWVIGAEIVAELLGASRLVLTPCPQSRHDVAGYVRRLGWVDGGSILYHEIGG